MNRKWQIRGQRKRCRTKRNEEPEYGKTDNKNKCKKKSRAEEKILAKEKTRRMCKRTNKEGQWQFFTQILLNKLYFFRSFYKL